MPARGLRPSRLSPGFVYHPTSVSLPPLRLGHFDPGFTLQIYTHLLPASEERTRRAIDTTFGRAQLLATARKPVTA
ncbi:hypothetical protein ACSNN7_22550 [Micromonospora sp. URMC 105]|uniref:hypothetical protein n=1 Tax=Micromonospora sp. URMC 105 TaxID=3423413 RepID=UPI003F1D570E